MIVALADFVFEPFEARRREKRHTRVKREISDFRE
jgi:hypothetical protein